MEEKEGAYNYNDGGRSQAGFKGDAGDCLVRAIAIATDTPYQKIYDLVNSYGKKERPKKSWRNIKRKSSARTGVYKDTARKIFADLGWVWVPTMTIGSGCKVHLKAEELPSGKIVCNVSKHYTAVVDGIINDTFDCSRGGERCVYGYWKSADRC
jgi:hypothetical protein